jgi:hypothetical protein
VSETNPSVLGERRVRRGGILPPENDAKHRQNKNRETVARPPRLALRASPPSKEGEPRDTGGRMPPLRLAFAGMTAYKGALFNACGSILRSNNSSFIVYRLAFSVLNKSVDQLKPQNE